MALSTSKTYGDYDKQTTPPENDLFIEWTYTFDLDNLLFSVDSKAHFSLRGIAGKPVEEWSQFLDIDARGHRCLALATPPDLVGQFERVKEFFLGGDPIPAVDDFVPTSTISPSIWSKRLTPHHQRLMLAQVHATIAETYSVLSTLAEVDVQNLAIPFLEAIIPNNQAIVLNRNSPALNVGNPKAAPGDRSPWFWYRGCLILLATQLDDNERFQVYVQAVAAKAKAKNRDRCTALLWSIRHVAVVEISGGTVSHSDPIPLLAAYGSDEDGFTNALHLLWHYLPYPRWRIVEERSASTGDFGSLPTEIALKVMMFTDQLHYPKYQFLSRAFFKLWWEHLRVGPYTILPDAEEVAETRSFKAYSADENIPVDLSLKVFWGKQTGSIWRSDAATSSDEPESSWWIVHSREKVEAQWRALREDAEDFSRRSTRYRLQRFCSYWPECLRTSACILPRVADQFSGESDVLFCEAEPM